MAHDTFSISRGLLCLAALVTLGQAQAQKKLDIGDPAPSLVSAKWLKGTPVTKFEKGKVYVVEFWATWCTPCKENIPHLTELAKKFQGKAQIAGISIWETQDRTDSAYFTKVEQFVKSQGDRMVYNVGVDQPKQPIADAWMKAAGEGGIPCSFVVGPDQKIAWIGHPAAVESVLSQVIAGKFDSKQAKNQRDLQYKYIRPIDDAMAAKQYAKALQIIESAIKADPSKERYFAYTRLTALFHTDLPKASAEADQILKETNGDMGAYQMVVSIFASGKDFTKPAYEYAKTKADEALAKGERKYMFLAMSAEIHASLGDYTEAIKRQEASIEAGAKDEHCPKDFLEFLKRNLQKIKDQAKAKS